MHCNVLNYVDLIDLITKKSFIGFITCIVFHNACQYSGGQCTWFNPIRSNQVLSHRYIKIYPSCKNLKDVKHLKLDIKNEITEKYKNLYKSKIDKIDESSKLFLYKNLEPSLERKFYLSFNDFSIRNIFTKFRISDHSLEIEKGGYNKTPCEERLCKNCGIIEDEAHFILKCKVNQNLRESLFNNIELDNDFFFKLFWWTKVSIFTKSCFRTTC